VKGSGRERGKRDVDITQRLFVGAPAPSAEDRFQQLVEGARDHAIVMLDADGRLLTWNAGARAITGYDAAEVLGRHHACLYLSEDIEADRPRLDLARAASEGSVEVDGWRRRKDATRYWASGSLTALAGEGGVRGFAAVTRDITERRRLEAQVRQAQRMEAVGHLAGGVAQDFERLLSIVLGSAVSLLERMGSHDPLRGTATIIEETAERAATLTRQLLTFSRRVVLDARVVDLNAVVSDTVRMLHRLLGDEVTLTTKLADGIARIKVDPYQLAQVLINLTVNARDAMPAGGKLTIETAEVVLEGELARSQPQLRPGRHVLLTVSDTGPGMPADAAARAFEPFFNAKGRGKGTGLGLAVVHGIVEQSGGQVEVVSEPGVGTTFRIHFPAVERPVASSNAAARRAAARGETRPSAG
jgi:PAS domain S-box-containing protein